MFARLWGLDVDMGGGEGCIILSTELSLSRAIAKQKYFFKVKNKSRMMEMFWN